VNLRSPKEFSNGRVGTRVLPTITYLNVRRAPNRSLGSRFAGRSVLEHARLARGMWRVARAGQSLDCRLTLATALDSTSRYSAQLENKHNQAGNAQKRNAGQVRYAPTLLVHGSHASLTVREHIAREIPERRNFEVKGDA
jgi:hypothetical protein